MRELSEADLPQATWQNQRLVFTHGYGVVASRVSTAGADGQPEFVARDIPVEAQAPALELTEPRLYFGENPPEYSIVGTDIDEFDYETADETVETRFTGDTGVALDGVAAAARVRAALRRAEHRALGPDLVGLAMCCSTARCATASRRSRRSCSSTTTRTRRSWTARSCGSSTATPRPTWSPTASAATSRT